jgi:hypothetical protein
MEKVETFDTPDISLAAFLHCKGVKLHSFSRVPIKDKGKNKFGNRYAILFEDKERCEKLQIDFANNAEVPVRQYDDSIRLLKMMIHSKHYNMSPREKELLNVEQSKK